MAFHLHGLDFNDLYFYFFIKSCPSCQRSCQTEVHMPALQVWLPTWGPSLSFPEVALDAQRAQRAWQGEQTVWLLQGLQASGRWREGQQWHLAVPAALLDCVHVYHVGENGYIYGPNVEARFPSGRVEGLLDAWLNVEQSGGVRWEPAPERLPWRMPHVNGEVVEYREGMVRVCAGGTAPVVALDAHRRGKAQWPPPGHPATISPDAESHACYTSQPGEDLRGVHMLLKWPGPLEALFPVMSGLDDLAAQAQLAQIARQSADDPQRALQRAREVVAPYITDGWTTQECAWYWPTLLERGEQGMRFAAEGRFRLCARSLTEALESKAWREVMTQSVSIRRVWGATGLLAGLLLDRLAAYQPIQQCERCGRILQGKRRKWLCSRAENPTCFRQRRAEDERRSWAKRRQKGAGQ
jgi:hypothetical protein